ncbi:MAG: hypothetical protein EOM05_05690 [Clostridia bacterium]|nr:hypothetical protein [Clostridia bacterium]
MKNNKLPSWKEKSTFEKTLTVLAILISITIMTLISLCLIFDLTYLTNVFEPLVGVLMLIQALQLRKYDKFSAAVSLSLAVFIFIISISILLN